MTSNRFTGLFTKLMLSVAWHFLAEKDATVKMCRKKSLVKKMLSWCSVKMLTKDHKIKKITCTGISNVGKIKVKCYGNVFTSKTTIIRD